MPLFKLPTRAHYRVLAVSDQVEPRLYGPTLRDVVQEVDMIIGCGDLPYYYLEYLISVLNRPLFYTHGNHDRPEHRANKSVVREPPGGVNLHRQIHQAEGLLIAGLEGSHRYNSNPAYQYTQNEMWAQALILAPYLLLNRLLYGRGLDLLVTHSPPFGIHDASDRPHIGFKAFRWLLRWFRPRYMLHGHQHVYRPNEITQTRFEQTEVINVYPFRVINLHF